MVMLFEKIIRLVCIICDLMHFDVFCFVHLICVEVIVAYQSRAAKSWNFVHS